MSEPLKPSQVEAALRQALNGIYTTLNRLSMLSGIFNGPATRGDRSTDVHEVAQAVPDKNRAVHQPK